MDAYARPIKSTCEITCHAADAAGNNMGRPVIPGGGSEASAAR
jgi:hypothetical protein